MPFFTVVLSLISRDSCPISYEYRNQRDQSPNAIYDETGCASVLFEPDRWIGFNEVEVHFMAQQLPNIAYPVPIQLVYFQRYRRLLETHLIIVGLSKLRPHPYTLMSFGSPIGSSISGRNMPLFPISTHLFKPGWNPKISKLGSV